MSAEEKHYYNRNACASCKHQRKRCPNDCILAPLFPLNRMEEFLAVHSVFGIANVTRMIKTVDPALREEAVKSFVWAASSWKQDPVHRPLGLYMESEQRRNFLERRNIFLEQRNSFLEQSARFLSEQDSNKKVVGMAPNYAENNKEDFNHGNGQSGLESSLVELSNCPPPPPPLVKGDQEMVGHGIGVVRDGVVHGRGFQGVDAHFSPELEAQRSNGRGDHGEYSTIYLSLSLQSHERGSAGSHNVAGHGEPVADPSDNFSDQHNQVKVETTKDSTPRKEWY